MEPVSSKSFKRKRRLLYPLLASAYEDYDIWIRDVVSQPSLSDGREWTFWQYTNRERLEGYQGEERFIDMNVFRGSEEDFAAYTSGL